MENAPEKINKKQVQREKVTVGVYATQQRTPPPHVSQTLNDSDSGILFYCHALCLLAPFEEFFLAIGFILRLNMRVVLSSTVAAPSIQAHFTSGH